MMWGRHNALYVEGAGRRPMPQLGGGPGVLPREFFFTNISSEKGMLGQF